MDKKKVLVSINKGKSMLIDRIISLMLNKYNLKIVSIPFYILNISSPTDILISFLSAKLGLSKVIITLIIAFLL